MLKGELTYPQSVSKEKQRGHRIEGPVTFYSQMQQQQQQQHHPNMLNQFCVPGIKFTRSWGVILMDTGLQFYFLWHLCLALVLG